MPSSLFSKLFDVEFTPEEALVVDSESLGIIAEEQRMAAGQYETEAERLKTKWTAEDARARAEMSKRQTQIDRMKYRSK